MKKSILVIMCILLSITNSFAGSDFKFVGTCTIKTQTTLYGVVIPVWADMYYYVDLLVTEGNSTRYEKWQGSHRDALLQTCNSMQESYIAREYNHSTQVPSVNAE